MYVCICHSVTERQIRQAAAEGAVSLDDLQRELGLGGTCGQCKPWAFRTLEAVQALKPGTADPTSLTATYA